MGQIHVASFSLNSGDFQSRASIFPERIYFNASGTTQVFSPLNYTGEYNWITSYPATTWEHKVTASTSAGVFYENSIQAGQFPPDFIKPELRGSFLLSAMKLGGNRDIRAQIFPDENSLLPAPSSQIYPVTSTSNPNKPHALIISKTRAYFFWLDATNQLHTRDYDGTNWTAESIVAGSGIAPAFGPSGSLLRSGANEYIAVAFPTSLDAVKIITFQDGGYPTIDSFSIAGLLDIEGTQVGLTQNPRDGKIYLCWLDNNKVYYKTGTFNPAASPRFTFSAANTSVSVADTFTTAGVTVGGYNNFETDFILPTAAGMKNFFLRDTSISAGETLTPVGYSTQFPYASGGNYYTGLIILSAFSKLDFYRRKLEFPDECSWQNPQKNLHIEGPPLLNTQVRAEVDFAEIIASASLARSVNSSGGFRAIDSGYRVIASESVSQFSLYFDKTMATGDYPTLVNNSVRLLAPDNSVVAISHVASTANELLFKPTADLQLNTTYRITVASSVLDLRGSQIYEDRIFSFTTQTSSSQVQENEIISISAFSNPGYTVPIASGSEVNASATIYLRLECIDPAFNTIDTAAVRVILNDIEPEIANITLTQTTANSSFFYGSFTLSAPHGGSHTYKFKTLKNSVYHPVKVIFPTLVSVTPNDGATGVLINTNPQLTFSENLLGASVTSANVRLNRGGVPITYSLSLSGNVITIDPDDSSEGYLRSESLYEIAAGYGLRDLAGNPFVATPATFTSSFTTQASQTLPLSISTVNLYSDAGFSNLVAHNADYSGTGTLYIEFSGADGQSLTRDYTIASISTGQTALLTEVASASGIYRGSTSFAGLQDRFPLKVQSVTSPAASASLLITWPTLTPSSPASGAVNVPVNSSIRIVADEALAPGAVTAANIKLLLDGVEIPSTLAYNAVNREITIAPGALLTSEKKYTVSVANQTDTSGNPQTKLLVYSFTVEDKTPPTIVAYFPADNATGVTIDRNLTIDFSENILPASVVQTAIKLTRNGLPAAYNLAISGSKVTVDPEDAPDNGMRTDTLYSLEVNSGIRDIAGNNLANVPEPFLISFRTQPRTTPPSSITSLSLFKDALLITSWGSFEKIPASATVYLKATGVDGATQTRDLATVTLDLSWAGGIQVMLEESASNSTGIYLGSYSFASLPLYGVPAPQPVVDIGTMTFSVDQAPANAATLTVAFPDLLPAATTVSTVSGSTSAAGASGVKTDTMITLAFSQELQDAGNSVSLRISSEAAEINAARILSADRRQITITPTDPLPYSATITVSGIYSDSGLRSIPGNPLYRPFSFSFATQREKTQPTSVSKISLFPDSSMSALSAFATNQDFIASGTMYIEATGADGADNTLDSTTVSISTGDSVELTETSASSGIYRGSYNYAGLADGFVFNVSSTVSPAASQTLLLSIPSLAPLQPASGAINVSNLQTIKVKASEPLDPASVNGSSFKLFKGAQEVSGTVSWLPTGNEIEFVPASPLDYNGDYIYHISAVKDPAGNLSTGTLDVGFKVQATSVTPANINSIKVFSDAGFATQLPDAAMVAPSSLVYVEISAVDLSPATTDATPMTISTNASGNTISASLIETGPATGIFRGTATIFADENAILTLFSATSPAIKTTLQTHTYPRLVTLTPASGSTNLYLDTVFVLDTSKPVDSGSLDNSSIVIAGSQAIASYQASLITPTRISIATELSPGDTVKLQVNQLLKDTDGLAFPDTLAEFTTLIPSIGSLQLYSDPGFSIPLITGNDVEIGQTLYARLIASSAWLNRPETATATYSDGYATSAITLDESNPGEFTGSFTVPDSPDQLLSVMPENRPDLATQLRILRGFSVSSISPASGSVNVPADVWPTWNFTRPVDPADVNSTNCRLVRLSDMTQVPVTFSLSPTGRQIRMQPSGLLPLLIDFEMQLESTLRDSNGNALGLSYYTRFSTQPPPPPPTEIISLKNYESAAYATSTLAVAVDDSLYLELVAKDTSFSTYETARVRVDSSDGTFDGLELTLVENAPPSGVYRLALPVNLPPGTTIRIQSQATPDFVITVTAHTRTILTGMTPASGSAGLYLDHPLTLTFSQPLDGATLANGMLAVASAGRLIAADFTPSDAGRVWTLTPQTGFASATRHQLEITTSLRDANGLFLLPQTAFFTTLGETSAGFDLLTGLPPLAGQSVAAHGEAVRGTATITASTTSMFATSAETRLMEFSTATQTFTAVLTETAPGSFEGTISFPAEADSQVSARLLFGDNPVLNFVLASAPVLTSVFPASNSTGISEVPVVSAGFSRRMSYDSAADALQIISGNTIVSGISVAPATDSTSLSWNLPTPLPVESSCTLRLSGLTDYLGQPLADYEQTFSTGGRQGINVFSENTFAQLIATSQLTLPQIFIEIAASGTADLAGRSFNLEARTGTRATETFILPVEAVSASSGLFRCSLSIAANRTVPDYALPLLPGEWLELTSPVLTSDRKLFYYLHSGSAGPANITDLRFFSEKNFAQRVSDTIANPSLYIEILAEDQNWFTSDKTSVRITSDADSTGFSLDLFENGTHSPSFRNFIKVSPTASDKAARLLKVLPDQRIHVVSEADPSIRASIKYLPENSLKNIAVYPSPARGNSVTFRFYLNFAAEVRLEIFDTAGDEIKGFVIRGQEGENTFRWQFPRHLANGVYFYQIKIDNESGFPTGKRKGRGKFAVLR